MQNATPGQLQWLLWNGNLGAGMPSWSGIPEQRRWQIVAYIKSLDATGANHARQQASSAANPSGSSAQ